MKRSARLRSPGIRAGKVSNVFDRERVLSTFEETLGFSAKVNFNAGVVAAGEVFLSAC